MTQPTAEPGEARDPTERTDELAVFYALAGLWDLTTEPQIRLLGSPGRTTFFKWKKEPQAALSRDTLDRISHLVSVLKALEILLPGHGRADGWLRSPNDYFDGRSALDVMLEGGLADIIRVRAYLDAQRGG
jgi:uncharacterized protein (DUF2384 family)